MDSVPSPSDDCGLVTASPADPDAGISEIAERILAEHARILRLFGALYDLAWRADPAVSQAGAGPGLEQARGPAGGSYQG